jgi:hypothetical protein
MADDELGTDFGLSIQYTNGAPEYAVGGLWATSRRLTIVFCHT